MPWHLAILGAGSAAAYFLNTADLNLYPKIVVLGGDDPWDGQRGMNPYDPNDPANFVNQTPQMIEHFGDTVPPMGTALYPRRDWAASNKKVFDQSNVTRIRCEILKVRQTSTPDRYLKAMNGATKVYSIEVKRACGEVEYLAAKVIVATGASSHKFPDKRFPELARRYPDLFMDMDAFGRNPRLRTPGKRIIVQGPNAAVDTVDTAAYNECTVYWLTGPPALLATPHQTGARAVKAGTGESRIYGLDRKNVDPREIKVEGKTIKITLQSGDKLEADHYVWGIGQDDKKAVSFIDPSLLSNLEPIYDVNQRHGQAFESVHGFQLKGTTSTEGFQIVGALSRQVLINSNKTLSHTYLEQLEKVIADLQNQLAYWTDVTDYGYDFLLRPVNELIEESRDLKRLIPALKRVKQLLANLSPTWNNLAQALASMIINWAVAKIYFDKHGTTVTDDDLNHALGILTRSTVGSPQLGSIRTTTAAINGFMPKYVSSAIGPNANFSQDDQTILRVYIAKNYPCVPEEDAARLIQKMVAGRPHTQDSWGYTDGEIQQFKDELQIIHNRWVGTLSTPKTVGTGQTVL
jgi:hypothetical protein